MDKKTQQLGMNPSTASGRLVKDILFKLINELGRNVCYQCGKEMLREDFSIEHKTPWLDSDKPKELFFDLANIAFSHHSRNVSAARRDSSQKRLVTTHGSNAMYKRGCRCELCKQVNRARVNRSRNLRPNKR
ncbi:hypothetical protein Arno162_71 [Pectobacterium phage Arno162]|uniref:Uncharacterized protein n=1 Tax=Pectobacterium phage Arno162 TaxID=2500577 RepID=A0A678ZX80_9CAUD|nr:hypothetical protein Arno162_71 [Pectobacterium phage Arno162]